MSALTIYLLLFPGLPSKDIMFFFPLQFPCVLLQGPILLRLIHLYQNDGRPFAYPPLHLDTCLTPGLLAGTIWNIGNIASIVATLPPLTTVG
jgi:hypothetical protein